MAQSIHKDHRKRMKERFMQQGLDGFTDIQALELLLFYSIPRQDTNPVAHKLLEHFGSLSQVLEAPAEELLRVGGIGEHSAVLLNLINQMSRFYLMDRAKREKVLPTIEDCARYLQSYFYGRTRETVFLLCLDAKCKALCCKEMGEGSVNSAGISVRKIVKQHCGRVPVLWYWPITIPAALRCRLRMTTLQRIRPRRHWQPLESSCWIISFWRMETLCHWLSPVICKNYLRAPICGSVPNLETACGGVTVPKFEVVSEYQPSGEPHKSNAFAGTP